MRGDHCFCGTWGSLHDWDAFQAAITERYTDFDADGDSLEAANKRFHEKLLDAAKSAAPFGSVRNPKPWWSAACGEAHRASLRAFRRMRAGLPGGAAGYAAARQAANQVYQREKKDCWRSYAATLTTRSPVSRVWGTLRAMDGRSRQPLPDLPLQVENKRAFNDGAKANATASHYANVSRLSIDRIKHKAANVKVREHISRHHQDSPLTGPFSLGELIAALRSSGGKSPGPDGVPPELLRHLPAAGLNALLTLLNRSWHEGRVPSAWKTAIIVPIRKKRKPAQEVRSY